MKKYKVLKSYSEKKENGIFSPYIGQIVEMEEAEAAHHVNDGYLEEVKEGGKTKVKNAYCFFTFGNRIDEKDNYDFSELTNAYGMFYGCKALTSLDLSDYNTSNVTNMQSMFYNCTALTSFDLSNFDTSNVTDMSSMFVGCDALTSLDVSSFDTSNVTNMNSMFSACYALTSLDLSNFDTSNVTDMGGMFSTCKALTSLDLSSFDTSNVTNMNSMFRNSTKLKTLKVGEKWVKTFDISFSTAFEKSDLMNIINALPTITTSQTMTIGSTNLAKLTDGEKAVATNKGWKLA